ncbi:MAG: hypothetical protein M1357_02270 [Candidatus Marsarchaeota archaeon]|nr:hypothetical protein [Candidatus Marsarchaeota archaeon]
MSPPAASPGDSPAFSSVDELVAICRERRVCAYELEWGVGARARLVAAPQAYLLSPHAWAKIGRYVSGAFAVVDECHNLASAARPGFSVEAPHVSRAGRYVAAALSRRKRWGSAALRRAFPQPDWVLSRLETEIEETAGSDPGKAHALVKEYEDLQALLNSECDALVVRGDHYEVFRGFSVEEVGSRMSCFSSAAMLSATPGDATYYQSLASDSPLYYERCDNPYTDGSLKVYIATDFTTRFVERSPLDAGQVASRILRITRLRPGLKIGAYFPSYEYMRAVAGALSEAAQSFSVNRGQRRWVEASVEEASVMLDVQGGSGSEGFDPPFGLDVSVAVGLALRHPGASRRTDAYDYAETDVAWAVQKAVQSVGRVVRGPSDSGVGERGGRSHG